MMMDHADFDSEEEFIAEMIPHHQEAIDTSRIISTLTQNTGLANIAEKILSGQTQEVSMMK